MGTWRTGMRDQGELGAPAGRAPLGHQEQVPRAAPGATAAQNQPEPWQLPWEGGRGASSVWQRREKCKPGAAGRPGHTGTGNSTHF